MILRNAERLAAAGGEFFSDVRGISVRKLEAIRTEPGAERRRKAFRSTLDAKPIHHAIRNNIDSSRRNTFGGLVFRAMTPGKLKEDGFNMLAGAKVVDAKIDAGAGKLPRDPVADFNLIRHPAGRLDLEIGKDGMARVEIGDAITLFAGTKLTLEDFVRVGRAPVGDRRQDGTFVFSAGGFRFQGADGVSGCSMPRVSSVK